MSASYNEIINILGKNLPIEVCDKIILIVYFGEHATKIRLIKLHDELVRKVMRQWDRRLYEFDPETLCQYWFNCMCCKKHQINKGYIDENGVSIITKPCVFKDNQTYNSDFTFGHECRCCCRHFTRMALRKYLKKNGLQFTIDSSIYGLYIRGGEY